MEKPLKRTKIVSTIGPASWPPAVLKKMIKNGTTVARVNGAFADVPELDRVAKLIRAISDDVALMLDIKGHELRLNKFPEEIKIKPGDQIVFGSKTSDPIYPVTYPGLYKEIKKGQIILIDKGEAKLEVTKISGGKIYATVINGTVIKGGKGMNVPGAELTNEPLTKRDVEQISFVVSDKWEFISASFIRYASDVKAVKKYLKGSLTKVISKIEDQQGVDNFDEILAESGGIMIARGDMGAEIPLERLPILQKEFIYKCNAVGKPVITATNMLESMIEKPLPTRAEITDVANAVLDGTDAVMTSGETSTGKYPVETIETMSRIATENEKYLIPEIFDYHSTSDDDPDLVAVAMTNAAFEVAQTLPLDKIFVVSSTGVTARLMSRHNLAVHVEAFVSNPVIKRQLALTKGVTAHVFPRRYIDRDHAIKAILRFALAQKIIKRSEKVLIIGRRPFEETSKFKFPNIFEYVDLTGFKL
ncbi:MAG: pyruvate kinase [Candidatus Dojkabacteria bacterium]